ncbi:MAG: cytochrome c [Candidatus Korobacteraceae bacterium]
MRSRLGWLVVTLLLISAIEVLAQTTAKPPAGSSAQQAAKPAIKNVPAIYTNPSSGRQMYDAYCASCHGQGGKGNGPAAPALKIPPTDLTQLAAKNGGTFPEAQVAQLIKGDSMMAAHGSKEMPVWGPIFLNMGKHDPALAQLRIRNLTKYVASMQQK